MEDYEEIEIRSDEVQEILSRTPSWMIRWGITLIFFIILGCLLMSYMVKYPDVINGTVQLTTVTPPAKLITKTNGEIEELMVIDGQTVKEGDVLAQIRNPLKKEAVTYLQEKTSEVTSGLLTEFEEEITFNDNGLVFGSLQSAYNDLARLISNYRITLKNGQFEKKKSILQKQISNYRKLDKISSKQLVFSDNNLMLAKDKYESNKELYDKNVISKVAFYQEEVAYTNAKNEVENLKKVKVQNAITLTDYERQLNELEMDHLSKQNELTKSIEISLNTIRNEINNWEETYLITAPVDGRVSFLSQLAKNKFVESGVALFAVIPDDSNGYIGYIEVDQRGYGKVEVGQDVKIKFDNFPSQEYGQIKGEVINISAIPQEAKYLIQVKLTDGLLSTYKKELTYTPEMAGQADIITEDLRIIERIFNQFREIFDE